MSFVNRGREIHSKRIPMAAVVRMFFTGKPMTARPLLFSTRLTSPAALPTSLMFSRTLTLTRVSNEPRDKGISGPIPEPGTQTPPTIQKPSNVLDFLIAHVNPVDSESASRLTEGKQYPASESHISGRPTRDDISSLPPSQSASRRNIAPPGCNIEFQRIGLVRLDKEFPLRNLDSRRFQL